MSEPKTKKRKTKKKFVFSKETIWSCKITTKSYILMHTGVSLASVEKDHEQKNMGSWRPMQNSNTTSL